MKNDTEITDIVELIRNGRVDQTVPEQELNFDAGFTPAPHVWKNAREECITIDGVRRKYICYS